MVLTPEQKEKVFQSFADLSEYFRLLRKETDRGCAMIVASHLDYMLGELLKAYMTQDEANQQEFTQFFTDTGLLGTFATRIKLARYLNIISSELRKDLDTIRRIRNDFAHYLKFEDFNTDSIRDRCMNLQHDVLGINENPRERFINAANTLIVIIDFLRTHNISFSAFGNPRSVEIALLQDIQNAAASVHTQASER